MWPLTPMPRTARSIPPARSISRSIRRHSAHSSEGWLSNPMYRAAGTPSGPSNVFALKAFAGVGIVKGDVQPLVEFHDRDPVRQMLACRQFRQTGIGADRGLAARRTYDAVGLSPDLIHDDGRGVVGWPPPRPR